MSRREILRWPDSRLSEVCASVGEITAEVRGLAEDMLETMYAAPGRGLAAPQIAVMQRIFVMDAGWKTGTPTPLVAIDPVIEAASTVLTSNAEGCLSIPGVSAMVARPEAITLSFTDLDGTRVMRQLTGFEALCAQHEIDHLNGIVTLDHLAPGERARVLREYAAVQA
jgi:peptide deformylase